MSVDAWSLRQGVHEQARVIYALIMRDIRIRFGQHRIGFAWAIVEPAIHIGILYALRSLVGSITPLHIPLLLWLLSGVVPMLMFRGIFQKVNTAMRNSKDVLILPRIFVMDILWARTFLEFGIYCTLYCVMIVMYAIIISPVHIDNPVGIMGCLVLLMLLGIGGGMIAMVLVAIFPSVQPLVSAMLRILYFTSGVFFTPTRIPVELHAYLSWNPLLHVFEMLHSSFFPSYMPLAGCNDTGYVLLWIIGLFIFGTLLKNYCMRLLLER